MRGIDSLYQYIVPLVFVAIWALTSLFNRESQPLPPRTSRLPGPDGPKPLKFPERRPESGGFRETMNAPRPSGQGPMNPATSRPAGGRRDDDIVILEVEPRRPQGQGPSPSRPGMSQPRRGSKTRPAGKAMPASIEQTTPRGLSASLTRPDSPPDIHSKSLKPLTLPASPLLTTPNDEAAKTQAGRALVSRQDSFSSEEIRRLVQTPGRLREGLIIAELLKPPLALRDNRFMPGRRSNG